tara:strand:+ start:1874 stop:2668 length:795 start_codon:yes stop_codon:yes gene_type:complete
MGLVVASTVIKKGDALFHNGTAWALADASDHTKPAQGFALNDVDSAQELAQRVNVSRHVYVRDDDAPFTAGDAEWLSETAGGSTHTRPTTAASLRQPIGEALTTKIVERVIRPKSYVDVPIVVIYATSANALLDGGNLSGPTMDAQNEVLTAQAILPKNFLRIENAIVYLAAEASGGTPTFDITVGSSIDGAVHDVVTADASLVNQSAEGDAVDTVAELDISTGLDATNIARPGAILGIKFIADDGGTDITFVFGGVITCEVAA